MKNKETYLLSEEKARRYAAKNANKKLSRQSMLVNGKMIPVMTLAELIGVATSTIKSRAERIRQSGDDVTIDALKHWKKKAASK